MGLGQKGFLSGTIKHLAAGDPVFISLYRNYQFINYFEEAGIVFLLKPGLTAMFPYHDFQSVFVPFGVKKKKNCQYLKDMQNYWIERHVI